MRSPVDVFFKPFLLSDEVVINEKLSAFLPPQQKHGKAEAWHSHEEEVERTSSEDSINSGRVEQEDHKDGLHDDAHEHVRVEGRIDEGELSDERNTFRDLQAKMLSHCTMTTAAKQPDCAQARASVVNATGALVIGLMVCRQSLGHSKAGQKRSLFGGKQHYRQAWRRSYWLLVGLSQLGKCALILVVQQLAGRKGLPRSAASGSKGTTLLKFRSGCREESRGTTASLLRRLKRIWGVKPQTSITMKQVQKPAAEAIAPMRTQECVIIRIVTNRSSLLLGLLAMMSTSGSSQASEMAGQMSVPTQMQSMKMLDSGRGICSMTMATKGQISVEFEVSKQTTVFLRLSNTFLPSQMPSIMEEKSSSSKTISAASLVTSDPEIPIEMPMSACLMAGASLTPSPVTPTMCPTRWQASTILNLCIGVVLEKMTSGFFIHSQSCLFPFSSLILNDYSISLPSTEIASASSSAYRAEYPSFQSSMFDLRVTMPICLAMERAVMDWSPVTMITFTPEALHFLIASQTVGFGGSAREINPMKVRPAKLSLFTS